MVIGALRPGHFQRRELRSNGVAADIDRRLLLADRASAVGGIEIAPFGGPIGPFVAPMVALGGETRRCAERAERKQFQGLTTMHGVPPDRISWSAAAQGVISRLAGRNL